MRTVRHNRGFGFRPRDARPMSGKQHEVTFRFLAQPTDVNFGGKVHGGMAMKWIDQAGYACAVGWSGAYCVTASVSGIQFVAPILIGDLVTVRARLIHTGTSSMHMAIDVLARDLRKDEQRLATSCVMVFVALDSPDGKPTPVPHWEPRDDGERRLQAQAKQLLELSKGMEQLVDLHAASLD
jgi:acyl-CoA hydrolase